MTEIKDIIEDTVSKINTVQSDREKLDSVNDAISKIKWEINATQDDIKKWVESLRLVMESLRSWDNARLVNRWFEDIDMSTLDKELITGLTDVKNELYLDVVLLSRELSFLYQNNQNPESFLLYEKRLNDTQWRQYRKEYVNKLNELPDKIIWASPNPASNEINITVDYSLVRSWYLEYSRVIRPFIPFEPVDTIFFNVLPAPTTINPLEGLPIIEQNWYSNNTEHTMWEYKDWSTTFSDEYHLHKNVKGENIVVEWSIHIVSMSWQPVLTPVKFKMDQDEDHQYTFDLSSLLPWTYIITIPEIQVFWKPLMKKIIKQ